MAFQNPTGISCTVTLDQTIRRDAKAGEERTKTILSNISASVRAGEILAVVGPSGSGKSTLLDAVAGRIETNSLEGEIRVNGVPMRTGFKRISAYVMQVIIYGRYHEHS